MKTGKRLLSVALAMLMLLSIAPVSSFALGNVVDSGDCSAEGSAVNWTYYDDHTMVISGTGAMSDSYDYVHKWYDYQIEKLVVKDGITHIGEDAFSENVKQYNGLDGISEISMPNSLKSIGVRAFEYCHSLKEVTIPDSVVEIGSYAFGYCYGLENVVFSKNVAEISSGLFRECPNLISVTNLDSVVEICTSAFYDCEKLKTIDLPDHGIIFNPYAFENTALVNDESNYTDGVLYIGNHLIKADDSSLPHNYSVREGTKSIAAYAFSEVGSLGWDDTYSIHLPDSIETVGYSVFFGNLYNGYTFTLSSLPKNIKHIGDSAFTACGFVDSDIVIPSSVEKVGASAFRGCDIDSLTINDGVKEIGERAFAGHNDDVIYIPTSLKTIGEAAFWGVNLKTYNVSPDNSSYCSIDGVLYSKDKTKLISYPVMKENEEFYIPDGTKTIAKYAFVGGGEANKHVALKKVTVPSSVVLIENQAFANCYYEEWIRDDSYDEGGYGVVSGLETVVFETGDRNLLIDSNAFYYCLLENISLPEERVYAISSTAFLYTLYTMNEENWEDGALYLGKILLGFNDDVSEEYSVKEGTTVIADNANVGAGYGEPYTDIVYLPESLIILGAYNVVETTDLPENLKRIGTSGLHTDELTEEMLYEKYGDYINGVDLDDSQLYDLVRVNFVYDGWLAYTMPFGVELGISDELFIVDDGIKGLVEGNILSLGGYSFAYAKGVILPQSFKTLSLATPLSNNGFINLNKEGLSLTFLSKDCDIFDHEDTISEVYTICGYRGSTAEAYATKYGRNFVAIENCKHPVTCKRVAIEPSCQFKGRTGDTCCQYCGALISKGTYLPIKEHELTEWETVKEATCSAEGEEKRECKNCKYEETRTIGVKEHRWLQWGYNDIVESWSATCTEDGRAIIKCWDCSETQEIDYGNATGHSDYNGDGYCDSCNELIDYTKICSCNCHKSGITNFFFKIILFFQRLFGINKICSCGIAHY